MSSSSAAWWRAGQRPGLRPLYTLCPGRCSWSPTSWTWAPSWTCSADPPPRACSPDSTARRTWPGPSSPARVRRPGPGGLAAWPPCRPGGGLAAALSPFSSGLCGQRFCFSSYSRWGLAVLPASGFSLHTPRGVPTSDLTLPMLWPRTRSSLGLPSQEGFGCCPNGGKLLQSRCSGLTSASSHTTASLCQGP